MTMNNHTSSGFGSTSGPNPGSEGGGRREDVRLGTASLLRAAADGELTLTEQDHLDQHLAVCPEDGARITFERDLRIACARVMASAGAGAPAGLRAAIEAQLSQSRAATAAEQPGSDGVAGRIHEGGRVEHAHATPARRGRRLIGLIAMAAAIPLVTAAWLVTVGRGGHGADGLGGSGIHGTSAATPLVSYLAREHCDCQTTDGHIKPVAPVPEAQKSSREELRKLVGQRVSIEDIQRAGFDFMGEGPSAVPGAGPSLHYLFKRQRIGKDGEPREVKLSLFIQRVANEPQFTEGITWQTQSPTKTKPYILAWEKEGLAYYLVTECSASRDRARAQLNAPETSGDL